MGIAVCGLDRFHEIPSLGSLLFELDLALKGNTRPHNCTVSTEMILNVLRIRIEQQSPYSRRTWKGRSCMEKSNTLQFRITCRRMLVRCVDAPSLTALSLNLKKEGFSHSECHYNLRLQMWI